MLGDGVTLTAIGVAAGGVASLLAIRMLRSMFSGLGAVELVPCSAAAALVAAVAIVASGVPAWRTTRLDAARTLRAD